MTENAGLIPQNNTMKFITNDGGDSYNFCQCKLLLISFPLRLLFRSVARPPGKGLMFALDWSNFEIADLDFWREERYLRFFDFLDRRGGFYYEVCSRSFVLFLAERESGAYAL